MTSQREQRARETMAALVNGQPVSADSYQQLRGHLVGYACRTFPDLADAVAKDIVDEGVTRLLAKIRAGDQVNAATTLAFVRRIVYNLAVDNFRQTGRGMLPLDDADAELLSDDAIARVVHESATAQSVERLLARAASDRDLVAVKVINAYLNLAGTLGSDPSSRTVAIEAGVSHTTVQNVLHKLKEQLSAEDFPE